MQTRTSESLQTCTWGLQTPLGVADSYGWVCRPCRKEKWKTIITIIIIIIIIIININIFFKIITISNNEI